jgi:hypothetical protein
LDFLVVSLNKLSRKADKGSPPAWGLGVGLTTPHRKNKLVTKNHKKPRTWTDSLDKRPKRTRKNGKKNRKSGGEEELEKEKEDEEGRKRNEQLEKNGRNR